MRKLRTYWLALQSSLIEPEYYYTLKSARALFSIQFFLLSLFLIAVCEIPNWAFRLLPTVTADAHQEVTHLSSQIPVDALFTYTGERLETQGIALPMTLISTQKLQDFGYPKELITITPDEKPTSSALTLTPTQAFLVMDSDPATNASYKDILGDEKWSASRDQLRSAAYAILDGILAHRFELSSAIALVGFVISIVTGLITIALYSIVVQTIGWLLSVRLTYRYALRWGLHIFPIALAIQEISHVLAPTESFPILTVAYFAIATLILWVGRSLRPTIII